MFFKSVRWRQTFDCGIVLVDKVALYQLNGEAGLSDTTTTDHDELVFSQELHGFGQRWLACDCRYMRGDRCQVPGRSMQERSKLHTLEAMMFGIELLKGGNGEGCALAPRRDRGSLNKCLVADGDVK